MQKSNYFSGFALKNESELFLEYINSSPYNLVGFSYGAIKAFELALTSTLKVDKLTLLSPAFFQNTSKSFKKTQLIYFKKNSKNYIDNFLKNSAFPSSRDLKTYLDKGTSDELNELLEYKWDKNKLQSIIDKGIKIDVYLGSLDKIIDTKLAYEYFKNYATIHYLKDKGHILCK